jgi:hypothetical protein
MRQWEREGQGQYLQSSEAASSPCACTHQCRGQASHMITGVSILCTMRSIIQINSDLYCFEEAYPLTLGKGRGPLPSPSLSHLIKDAWYRLIAIVTGELYSTNHTWWTVFYRTVTPLNCIRLPFTPKAEDLDPKFSWGRVTLTTPRSSAPASVYVHPQDMVLQGANKAQEQLR